MGRRAAEAAGAIAIGRLADGGDLLVEAAALIGSRSRKRRRWYRKKSCC